MRGGLVVVVAAAVVGAGLVVAAQGPQDWLGAEVTAAHHHGAGMAVEAPRVVAAGAVAAEAGSAWSDPATWGGKVPGAGTIAVIPKGKTVRLNVDPPALAGIEVEGTLVAADRDLKLTTGYIHVMGGTFKVGASTKAPFMKKAQITLTGAMGTDVMGMGTRGILVHDGVLNLFGNPTATPWTTLNAQAAAGARKLTLAKAVDWKAGDQALVAPSDFYGVAQTEQKTISAVSGTGVTLDGGLAASRWGVLQYVTKSGMSLKNEQGHCVVGVEVV